MYNEKTILEDPADFPLNTTFVSCCLKVGKIPLVSTGHFVPPSRNYRHSEAKFALLRCSFIRISRVWKTFFCVLFCLLIYSDFSLVYKFIIYLVLSR